MDRGCRADFTVGQNGYVGGRDRGDYRRDRDGNDRGQNSVGQTLTCSSDDGKRHYCNADTSGGVQMTNQRSGSPCRQGESWGYDQRGVWVDRGCRADFVVGQR